MAKRPTVLPLREVDDEILAAEDRFSMGKT
jgi:hypothetical protein